MPWHNIVNNVYLFSHELVFRATVCASKEDFSTIVFLPQELRKK